MPAATCCPEAGGERVEGEGGERATAMHAEFMQSQNDAELEADGARERLYEATDGKWSGHRLPNGEEQRHKHG